jgi:hypothetical protein
MCQQIIRTSFEDLGLYMYVGLKQIASEKDPDIDLSREIEQPNILFGGAGI